MWRPQPDKCEDPKWHSRQKHSFLEAYLKVWTQHVGQSSRSTPISLDIVDLNAGLGWCYDEESGEQWEGTAVLAAQHLREYDTPYGKRLILNSYAGDDATPDEQGEQVETLKEAIRHIGLDTPDRVDEDTRVEYMARPYEDAIPLAKEHARREYANLWILDPYKSHVLPWEQIEEIVSWDHGWDRSGGGSGHRRPEILLTFMTWSLQKEVDKNTWMIDQSLGMEEDQWRPKLNEWLERDFNTREALRNILFERLGEYYENEPYFIKIQGVEGNIPYLLVFCSDSDAGYHMVREESLPHYEEWRGKWERVAEHLKAKRKANRKAEKEGQEQRTLFDPYDD